MPFLANILLAPVCRDEVSRHQYSIVFVLELGSRQVLTAAGCHNAECSLGRCNCQVTVGTVPKGLLES